jgi:hypothetical protein
MDNRDISPAQAQEWLQFNRAAGPQRLHALARWVVNTGGPIDELGSSLESLDTLWAWFLDFMGSGLVEQIPADSQSDQALAFDFTSTDGPLALAAEALAEYTLQVIRQTHPDANWSLFPHEKHAGIPMLYENEVGMSTQGEWHYLHAWTVNLAGRAKRGVPQALAVTRLREIVVKHLPTLGGEHRMAPRFLLRDALSFAGPVVDPPRFSLVEAGKHDSSRTPSTSEPFDAVALIHVCGEWGDDKGLPALPETHLAVLLTELGLVDLPQNLRARLRQDHLQLMGHASSLMVETFADRGRLRSLAFEPVTADQATWNAILLRLQAFASEHPVQIVRADDGAPAAQNEDGPRK